MIPLSAEKTIEVVSEEGVSYEFGYLIGARQEEYIRWMNDAVKNSRRADRLVKSIEGKSDEEIGDEFTDENMELEIALMRSRKKLINLFLVKIDGAPAGPAPAEALLPADIAAIAAAIQENLPELSGKRPDEALKN